MIAMSDTLFMISINKAVPLVFLSITILICIQCFLAKSLLTLPQCVGILTLSILTDTIELLKVVVAF